MCAVIVRSYLSREARRDSLEGSCVRSDEGNDLLLEIVTRRGRIRCMYVCGWNADELCGVECDVGNATMGIYQQDKLTPSLALCGAVSIIHTRTGRNAFARAPIR